MSPICDSDFGTVTVVGDSSKVCAYQTAQQRFDFSTHFLSIKVSKLVATLEGQPEPGLLVIAAMDEWNSLVNLTIHP